MSTYIFQLVFNVITIYFQVWSSGSFFKAFYTMIRLFHFSVSFQYSMILFDLTVTFCNF